MPRVAHTPRYARSDRHSLLREADLDPLDAELLLAHVLGVEREWLWMREPVVGEEAAEAFGRLADRRRAGEPVAYLTGRRAFRWLELRVDERVLIPRPETEHLVEAALDLPRGARVVDVGTGSGAVALALKHERPDLRLVGVDVSPGAIAVARANGERLGLDVEWRHGDLLEGMEDVDAVVANLPYVEDGTEPPFEPPLALRGGPDGLDVIRRLIAQAHTPFLALEVGANQAVNVTAMCRGRTRTILDLAGIERVVVAER